MHICGIIAEYDPFHTGHAYQIKTTKDRLGEDCAIVCVMSGNWTQRAGPAIVDKHQRARFALMGGADLVLELPLPYAISSAEWFAHGGVSILNAAGIITHLCFGSECADISLLQQTANCLDCDEYREFLRNEIDKGISFPVARQNAAAQLLGNAANCLSSPNNNLGVEYLRALSRCGSAITPITVQRQGAGHNEGPLDGYASATHLRQLLHKKCFDDTAPFLLPCEAEHLYKDELADVSLAERAIIARLRQLSVEELAALPDCGEGLSNRLHQAIRQGTSLDEIIMLAKSKRYTHSRLRRILLWAYLGLSADDRPSVPPYLRVLGMNQTGRMLLREISAKSNLPVLTKPAHVRQMSAPAQQLFELEARATDLYALCFPTLSPCGKEWTQGPVIF